MVEVIETALEERPARAAPQRLTGLTVGVDVGGTKVAAGVVDPDGEILATTRRDTPADDPQQTAEVIADAIRELAAHHDVMAVGLGAAGFVDSNRSTVLFAPNLAWLEEPLRAAIEASVGLPTVVENDANAAAWAEVRFGAGRGEDYVVVLTVGTGIGVIGDVAALQCFDELGRWLGRGMAQLAAILDPGLFVIGGGVSTAGEILRERTVRSYRKHLTARGHRPIAEIRIAELGPEAGIVGAADLARS
jgi:predicted NBD/HSP70 family sugar kinase